MEDKEIVIVGMIYLIVGLLALKGGLSGALSSSLDINLATGKKKPSGTWGCLGIASITLGIFILLMLFFD